MCEMLCCYFFIILCVCFCYFCTVQFQHHIVFVAVLLLEFTFCQILYLNPNAYHVNGCSLNHYPLHVPDDLLKRCPALSTRPNPSM